MLNFRQNLYIDQYRTFLVLEPLHIDRRNTENIQTFLFIAVLHCFESKSIYRILTTYLCISTDCVRTYSLL